MNKFELAAKDGKIFAMLVTCGDPDLETTAQIIRNAAQNGADIIELALPFSDPTAESPVLQESSIRALKNGVTTDTVFEFVKEIRKEISVPFVFKTYANVVFSYGSEKFISLCSKIGVDALIIPDLPFEEKDEFQPLCTKYGVKLISIVTAESEKRVSVIAKEAEGFLYVIADVKNSTDEKLCEIITAARQCTNIPCLISGGISTAEEACKAAAKSDGIIVGSEIIRLIEKHQKNAPEAVAKYVKEIKTAVHGK